MTRCGFSHLMYARMWNLLFNPFFLAVLPLVLPYCSCEQSQSRFRGRVLCFLGVLYFDLVVITRQESVDLWTVLKGHAGDNNIVVCQSCILFRAQNCHLRHHSWDEREVMKKSSHSLMISRSVTYVGFTCVCTHASLAALNSRLRRKTVVSREQLPRLQRFVYLPRMRP